MTRRRYRYNEETKELEEISLDAPIVPRVELSIGSHYDGLRATDGTPIDTRQRHREYMRRNGLAVADDYKQTLSEAPSKRAAEARAGLRDSIGRTIHHLENRRRR